MCLPGLRRYPICMSREQYKTPDDEMAEEFGRVIHLFQETTSKTIDQDLFKRLMNEASAKGLNWIQGLEYVLQRRHLGNRGGSGQP